MRVTLLLILPCVAKIRLLSTADEEVRAIQKDNESNAAFVGASAISGGKSSAARVHERGAQIVPKSPPELEYLQSQASEDDLFEISYLDHRIISPDDLRDILDQERFGISSPTKSPSDRFREEFEHLQSSLPDSGDVAAKRNKTPAIFLHIHKYGGTSMCLLAKLNGEQLPPGGCNCNFCQDACMYSQGLWGPKHSRMPPSDYGKAMIPHTSVSYAQIERDLLPDDLDQFLSMNARTGVMLRDPMEGVLANIVAHKIPMSDLETALELGDFRRVFAHEAGCLKDAGNPDVFGHLLQSFATRSLSGFFDAKTTTDEHLEKAKRNLDKFDVVQILEDVDMPKFAESFGWNGGLSLTKPTNAVEPKAKYALRERLEAHGLWDSLCNANDHDTKLYEYARAKFR